MDSIEPLVSPEWLAEHMASTGTGELRIVDVRWALDTGPQRAAYLDGHIPGSVFADLDVDLSAPAGSRGRHPLPAPAHFAEARRRLGIDGRPVVAYDQRGGPVAARLWWMLDAIGVPAAVLDGGIDAWEGPLERGTHDAQLDAQPEVVPWPEDRFVRVDEVLPAIENGAVLLDARSPDRFAGKKNEIDARPGHIPGSMSRPWDDNLDETGRFVAPSILAEQFAELGVDAEADLVACCGSGVTGCHNLLAARIAGLPTGRLYVGSWSEWSLDPDRPVDTGLS